jgi:cyanate permease
MSDGASPTSAARVNRGLVTGLAVTQTVGWGVLIYALPVVLVPMQDDLGWTRSTIIGAYASAIVVSGLLAPAVGRHLDRDRPRALMLTGSVVATLMVAGWSQVGHPVALYAVWLVIGIAQATVLYEAAFPVIIKRCAPHHTSALLTVTLAGGLASFIFQPLTSWLTSLYGWRTALIMLAVILGAVTIPIHWMVLTPGGDRRRPRPARRSDRRIHRPRARIAGMLAGRVGEDGERIPELRERVFWTLTAAFVAVTMTSFAAVVLLIAFLQDAGWSLSMAAVAGGTLGAMQLPGRLALSRLVGRVGNDALAPTLLVIPAAGVVLLLVSAGNWLAWPAAGLLGIGQGATILLRAAIYVDLYGTERIGTLNGASALPITLARAMAPLGASAIVARTGGYTVAFVLLAGLSVAAAIAARRALTRHAETARQPESATRSLRA